MMVIVDYANPDRAATYLLVSEASPEYDPVKIARQLNEAIPRAIRVRTFYPGGSTDTANGGDRSPADVLADVVARLLPARTRVVRPASGDGESQTA
ncbi:hypothetical protein [Frankia tisae]|uniref:hypothetical protein n=1 Tax=Frankia tisae TaxID=2950104 RepID=UPI0021C231C8|nr:hypothetical protein [Frankia tisae]